MRVSDMIYSFGYINIRNDRNRMISRAIRIDYHGKLDFFKRQINWRHAMQPKTNVLRHVMLSNKCKKLFTSYYSDVRKIYEAG